MHFSVLSGEYRVGLVTAHTVFEKGFTPFSGGGPMRCRCWYHLGRPSTVECRVKMAFYLGCFQHLVLPPLHFLSTPSSFERVFSWVPLVVTGFRRAFITSFSSCCFSPPRIYFADSSFHLCLFLMVRMNSMSH
jgi:hypothetical protein